MATSGAELRRLREEAGISREALAEALGQWPGAIQHVERAAQPRNKTVQRYLAGLERVKAQRQVREVEAGYQARLAVIGRARELVEQLGQVLAEASL